MNYEWKVSAFYRIDCLRTVYDSYTIEVDAHLMWPYAHLYTKILKDKRIIVDFCLEYINFVLHLTPGDYISDKAKFINIPKGDYFQIMIKVLAYTNYYFPEKLYEDINNIYTYTQSSPNNRARDLIEKLV